MAGSDSSGYGSMPELVSSSCDTLPELKNSSDAKKTDDSDSGSDDGLDGLARFLLFRSMFKEGQQQDQQQEDNQKKDSSSASAAKDLSSAVAAKDSSSASVAKDSSAKAAK